MEHGINLRERLDQVDDHWAPRTVAAFNGHDIMVVRVSDEFVWHVHDDTDDYFLVLGARLVISSAIARSLQKKRPSSSWSRPACRKWVTLATFEPFNAHFVRDIGAIQAGVGFAGVVGALRVRPAVVGLAGLLAFQVLHVASHIVDRDAGGRPGFDIPAVARRCAHRRGSGDRCSLRPRVAYWCRRPTRRNGRLMRRCGSRRLAVSSTSRTRS